MSVYEMLINNNEGKMPNGLNECNPLHKERYFLSNNSCGDESSTVLQYLEPFPMWVLFNRRKKNLKSLKAQFATSARS